MQCHLYEKELVEQVGAVAVHKEDDCFGRALGLQIGSAGR